MQDSKASSFPISARPGDLNQKMSVVQCHEIYNGVYPISSHLAPCSTSLNKHHQTTEVVGWAEYQDQLFLLY